MTFRARNDILLNKSPRKEDILMTERKIYHVVPDPNGGWKVILEGGKRASRCFPTKSEATAYGRNLAKKAELGQLKIHKKDGSFQTEYTYGNDPFPPEG